MYVHNHHAPIVPTEFMNQTGNPEKAHRYLGLLDSALCNGQWHEIQELARKVDKHAPTRKCILANSDGRENTR